MKLGFWRGWGKPFSLGIGTTGGGESDDIAPTCAISSSDSDPTIVSPITFTFTWSEGVTGFAVGDVTVGNGTKDTFTELDSSHYTLTVIPNAGATVTVDVDAGVCTDSAGNPNAAATQYTVASKVLLWDDFTDTRAAGAVNGTAATPGPGGNRVVTDTNSKLSVGSDIANFATGGAGAGNPGLWYGSVARGAGMLQASKVTPGATSRLMIGFDSNQTGTVTEGMNFFTAPQIFEAVTGGQLNISWSNGTAYSIITVERAAGTYTFIKTGTGKWKLLMIHNSGTTATLFPAASVLSSTTTISQLEFMRVFKSGTWLPTPFVYDTFTRANGSLGNSETTGPDGQTGVTSRAWAATTGTWAIASNAANCSALAGGLGFATLPSTNADVVASVGYSSSVTGSAGLLLRYQDTNNYLFAYHDREKLAMYKRESGTNTALFGPTTVAYSSNANIMVVIEGTSAYLYYANVFRAAVTVPSSSGTVHGMYAASTSPVLDNFMLYPLGTGDEHSGLDAYTQNFLAGDGLTPLHEYSENVLALNPLAYWPCNEWTGFSLHDETGNGRTGAMHEIELNLPGKYGAAVQFEGITNSRITASLALNGEMDMNEYSIAFWVKMNTRVDLQARWLEQWDAPLQEYTAFEVRSGNLINLFSREGGIDQNVNESVLGQTEDEVWAHVVLFNSLSEGKIGIYYNGVLREVAKTLSGATGPIYAVEPEINPVLGGFLDACMQHIAFFDHKLTQVEVNSICT